MEKIRYLFRVMKDMSFKNMFSTIKELSEKTNKSSLILFFDVIWCGWKYQAGYLDYKTIAMYNLNRAQRNTHITRGIFNHYIKKYNNQDYIHFFLYKNEFNEKFFEYSKRDWLLLDGNNEEAFKDFLKDKKEIIAKPLTGTHGKGVIKIASSKANYQELISKDLLMVEEVIQQVDIMNKLNPSSINTVRVLTFYNEGKAQILRTSLRIGNKGVVDNFSGGGMLTQIDPKTHKVQFPAVDKEGKVYYQHPVTGTEIIGFEIPQYDEIIETCLKACSLIEEVKIVGWDVAISKKGICLIEGNEFPSHDLYQLPAHHPDGYGSLPEFKAILDQ